jgi:fibronectin type 3 domain-containing protein
MLLNPASLSFSGTAGGANPLAQTINLLNPTGGTLSWTMTESAPWLALNITTGTTTTETDQISASVGISGLSAGTYSTIISVTASDASNSPQPIPVSLTLSQPTATTTGSAGLSWTANTETDLAGYKVYIGTQSGLYNTPITLGTVAAYTAMNLASGKTYYFCISAFDSAGNDSPCSAEVSKPLL